MMNDKLKLEKLTPKNPFIQYLYNPIVWVIVLGFLFSIHSFVIKGKFIVPLEKKFNARLTEYIKINNDICTTLKHKTDLTQEKLKDHLHWCDTKLLKNIENRPTEKDLKLVLEPLRNDIHQLQKNYEKLEVKLEKYFDEIKKLIIAN